MDVRGEWRLRDGCVDGAPGFSGAEVVLSSHTIPIRPENAQDLESDVVVCCGCGVDIGDDAVDIPGVGNPFVVDTDPDLIDAEAQGEHAEEIDIDIDEGRQPNALRNPTQPLHQETLNTTSLLFPTGTGVDTVL